MKKILIFLISFSSSAFAEWVQFGYTDSGNQFYFDSINIKKNYPYIKVWVFSKYANPLTALGEMSSTSLQEFNCKNDEFRMAYISYYKDRDGKSVPLHSESKQDNFRPIIPGSISDLLLKKVCIK